jgi:hypothetical protein
MERLGKLTKSIADNGLAYYSHFSARSGMSLGCCPWLVWPDVKRRTFPDVILGRRDCVVDWPYGRYRFSVARGAIVAGPTLSLVYGGQEVMLDVF